MKKYKLYEQNLAAQEVIDFLQQREKKLDMNTCCREHMALNLLGDPEPGANRLLDFGCGWGYLSRRAVDKGWSVVGIDLSTNELDIARLYSSHKQYKSNPLFLERVWKLQLL
jgi:2-polyprenyl-3-methyl-5-hydroxy-6-metoxy-1,4-benzoquinol methylase